MVKKEVKPYTNLNPNYIVKAQNNAKQVVLLKQDERKTKQKNIKITKTTFATMHDMSTMLVSI